MSSREYTPDKKEYHSENELTDEFCRKDGCHQCDGTDMNGEPNGYGCEDMEAFVAEHAHLVVYAEDK